MAGLRGNNLLDTPLKYYILFHILTPINHGNSFSLEVKPIIPILNQKKCD